MYSPKSFQMLMQFLKVCLNTLRFVVVQLHVEWIVQVHCATPGLIDAEERKDLVHILPACKHCALAQVLFAIQEIDLSHEIDWDHLHDSLGDLRIKSFELLIVLVEHKT